MFFIRNSIGDDFSLKKAAGSGAGFVCQSYGYADPYPFQNVTDPESCRLWLGSPKLMVDQGSQ